MGWFTKDNHEAAHNEGQKDGAKDRGSGYDNYRGTLISGRSYAEQQSYNDGYNHSKKEAKD